MEVPELYHCVFDYPDDKVFINNQSFFTLPENNNKIPHCFFDINISSVNGLPVKKANIHVFKSDKLNKYNMIINSKGHYSVQFNNIQFYPGIISKFYINMIPFGTQDFNRQIYKNIMSIQAAEEPPQDEVREMNLTLGMTSPKDTVTYLFGKKFADEVNALSDGKINIEIYTDGKLGTDREMFRSILHDRGPDFLIQPTANHVSFLPKLSFFDMPMIYSDIDKLRNTIDNKDFYEKISNIYQESGLKLLGFSDKSFRQMTANKRIQNIEDFGGIKIRTIQNPNHETFWQLLGDIVVPLPVGEVYNSLYRGFIDAEENPYENIVGFKFYEVQDYVINTNHLPHILALITNKEFFDNLTEAEKAIIEEAASNSIKYARNEADNRLEREKQILIDNGLQILELPEETRQDMIKFAAEPVYESIRELVNDDELIDTYVELSNTD